MWASPRMGPQRVLTSSQHHGWLQAGVTECPCAAGKPQSRPRVTLLRIQALVTVSPQVRDSHGILMWSVRRWCPGPGLSNTGTRRGRQGPALRRVPVWQLSPDNVVNLGNGRMSDKLTSDPVLPLQSQSWKWTERAGAFYSPRTPSALGTAGPTSGAPRRDTPQERGRPGGCGPERFSPECVRDRETPL